MSLKRRFWFLAYPDLTKAIGGIKQIHRVAEIIEELGCQAFLVQDQADFHPHWFESTVNTVSRNDWMSRTDLDPLLDIIIFRKPLFHLFQLCFLYSQIIFNQNVSIPLVCRQEQSISPRLFPLFISIRTFCRYGAYPVQIMTSLSEV